MDYEARFETLLDQIKSDGRYRTFIELDRIAGGFPEASHRLPDGTTQPVTVWCSNDYLGMGQHADVLAAMQRTIERSGAGAGDTRNISGTNAEHVALEADLADLHGKGAALLLPRAGFPTSRRSAPSGAHCPIA